MNLYETTVNANAVIEQLVRLPQRIADEMRQVLLLKRDLIIATDRLKDREAVLLTTEGAIEGKNAESRSAALRIATSSERRHVASAQEAVDEAERKLRQLQDEQHNYRAISRMWGAMEVRE